MTIGDPEDEVVRVAAAGDIHCREANREAILESFREIGQQSDLVLLAGDLTTHGEPQEAEVLCEARAQVDLPVLAVLGNHDHHCDRAAELTAMLEAGAVQVLDRSSEIVDVRGAEVGVVGAKGFVGGFPGSHLPDFGEPLLRQVYRETSEEVEAIDRELAAIAHCPVRIVLLHYAPTIDTIRGEPEGIFTMLGSSRLADPVREHEPDLVLHGHAHAGTFEGAIGITPVRNVSVPVMGQDFWVFDLPVTARPASSLH